MEGSKWSQLPQLDFQESCLCGENFLFQLRQLYDGPGTHHFNFTWNKYHPNAFEFIFCMTVSFRTH